MGSAPSQGTPGRDRRIVAASVIVPVHGKWAVTQECLTSVVYYRGMSSLSIEVIVVDDQSPDHTAEMLKGVPGITVVTTPTNLGFVGACNLGAAAATGDILVFLNNDTLPREGWLEYLVDVLDSDASVGVVGSLLLGPDGHVQESGGIIWSDGSGWNFGRHESASFAPVRARRDVDYCSGAALAVRRTLFEELGGFDSRYSPAYYEDTDLCFAARAAGYRVVVEPRSVVVHLEGVSNGVDGEGGLKRFQTVNRQVFCSKWREQLSHQRIHRSAADVWRASNRTSNGMVLIVEPHVPTPDRDSGSRRMAAIVEQLVDLGCAVYYACGERIGLEPYRSALEAAGVTVLVSWEDQVRFLEEAGSHLQMVMLCRPPIAWGYLDLVYRHAPQATLVYDTVDLHGLRMARQAVLEGDHHLTEQARLMWIKERAAMEAADVTLVVSETEQLQLRELAPELDVRVVSNIHAPVVTAPGLEGRSDVTFIGGYLHPPNVDAALWAVNEIMPRVRQQLPGVRLRLVGSFMPDEFGALDGPDVDVRGWVADLGPCYRETRVVIAPLRFGAGVKGKVGEAIEHGVPVVGTSVAFEAMGMRAGEEMLLADDADGLAAATVRLLTDDDLWMRMSTSAQHLLHERFSPATARGVLEQILNARFERPRQTGLGVDTAVRVQG